MCAEVPWTHGRWRRHLRGLGACVSNRKHLPAQESSGGTSSRARGAAVPGRTSKRSNSPIPVGACLESYDSRAREETRRFSRLFFDPCMKRIRSSDQESSQEKKRACPLLRLASDLLNVVLRHCDASSFRRLEQTPGHCIMMTTGHK